MALFGGTALGLDPQAPVATQSATSAAFFHHFTGQANNGTMVGGRVQESIVFWAIVFALNVYFVFRGLSKGIEKFCTWAMPAMAVCALIVLGYVLTLPPN